MQVADMAALMCEYHFRQLAEILFRYVYASAETEGGGVAVSQDIEFVPLQVCCTFTHHNQSCQTQD